MIEKQELIEVVGILMLNHGGDPTERMTRHEIDAVVDNAERLLERIHEVCTC